MSMINKYSHDITDCWQIREFQKNKDTKICDVCQYCSQWHCKHAGNKQDGTGVFYFRVLWNGCGCSMLTEYTSAVLDDHLAKCKRNGNIWGCL